MSTIATAKTLRKSLRFCMGVSPHCAVIQVRHLPTLDSGAIAIQPRTSHGGRVPSRAPLRLDRLRRESSAVHRGEAVRVGGAAGLAQIRLGRLATGEQRSTPSGAVSPARRTSARPIACCASGRPRTARSTSSGKIFEAQASSCDLQSGASARSGPHGRCDEERPPRDHPGGHFDQHARFRLATPTQPNPTLGP